MPHLAWSMSASANHREIALFHEHILHSIDSRKKELEEIKDGEVKNKVVWEHRYSDEGSFITKLNEYTFLSFFGYLEEHLFLLSNETATAPKKGTNIDRFKPVVKEVLGISDIKEVQEWQSIRDFHTIRNTIMHGGGRIDLAREPDKLSAALDKHKEIFKVVNKRIVIRRAGIREIDIFVLGFIKLLENGTK